MPYPEVRGGIWENGKVLGVTENPLNNVTVVSAVEVNYVQKYIYKQKDKIRNGHNYQPFERLISFIR